MSVDSIAGPVFAAALALTACSGFAEVADSGLIDGGPRTDAPDDATAQGDAPAAPDLGGKLPAGECCGKNGDCASNLCLSLGKGAPFCSATCTTTADTCPVGFGCSAGKCGPPSEHYQCGPHVAMAKPQGLGGCCGKATDCISGRCRALGSGAYFCSQTCTISPDNCPVKYVCGSTNECAPSGTYTCTVK